MNVLNMSYCLLSTWDTVRAIVAELPALRTLSLKYVVCTASKNLDLILIGRTTAPIALPESILLRSFPLCRNLPH